MISVDNYLNETTRHAHVILPGPSPLEQPHFDDLHLGLGRRAAARTGAIRSSRRRPTGPHEWEILTRLGWLCTGQARTTTSTSTTLDDGFFAALCRGAGLDAADDRSPQLRRAAARSASLDLQVRTGPWGDRYGEVPDGLTLEQIKAQPHGIDLGPMVPACRRDGRARPTAASTSRPSTSSATCPASRRASPSAPTTGSVLVSRRHLRSNNSWMHNVKVLVKGKDRCTLLVHPDDAARHRARRRRPRPRDARRPGSVEVPVEVSDEMMPGVVSLPHGWGHDRPGTRHGGRPGARRREQQPARARHFVDPLSNNARGQRHPGRGRARLTVRAVSIAPGCAAAYDARNLRARSVDQGDTMKKLLIILILAAIGIAVAKKVREA